jgi:hypothetical protein
VVAVVSGLGQNGHWVRTRTPEGAKAFLQEKQMEAERHQAAAARSRARRRAATEWIKARWRRLLSR